MELHGTASASRPALQPRRPIPNQNTRRRQSPCNRITHSPRKAQIRPIEWRRPSPGTTRPITRVTTLASPRAARRITSPIRGIKAISTTCTPRAGSTRRTGTDMMSTMHIMHTMATRQQPL
ncbi:hypothetical protein HQS1_46230 [Delftia lacustris]|nr:hypothetical protein HQS1_46230 [Delftia lacustris]